MARCSDTGRSKVGFEGPKNLPKKQLEAVPDYQLLAEVARRLGCGISPGAKASKIVPKKRTRD